MTHPPAQMKEKPVSAPWPCAGLVVAALVAAGPAAHAQAPSFTTDIPACRMPAGSPMPDRYLGLARRYKEFAWVKKVKRADMGAYGNGWERIDGSSMYEWFAFYRVDLNNDGYCDWFVNAAIPLSSGGDRDSINTLYLGQRKGWRRIGPPIPADRPDGLGSGKSDEQQSRYLFGEEPALLYDPAARVRYIITGFDTRHTQRLAWPGYRIFVWDDGASTLRLLDKWAPGSNAAAAYDYFKAHGARMADTAREKPEDTVTAFDPEVEAYEVEQACESAPASVGEGPSPHLLARCKRPAP